MLASTKSFAYFTLREFILFEKLQPRRKYIFMRLDFLFKVNWFTLSVMMLLFAQNLLTRQVTYVLNSIESISNLWEFAWLDMICRRVIFCSWVEIVKSCFCEYVRLLFHSQVKAELFDREYWHTCLLVLLCIFSLFLLLHFKRI